MKFWVLSSACDHFWLPRSCCAVMCRSGAASSVCPRKTSPHSLRSSTPRATRPCTLTVTWRAASRTCCPLNRRSAANPHYEFVCLLAGFSFHSKANLKSRFNLINSVAFLYIADVVWDQEWWDFGVLLQDKEQFWRGEWKRSMIKWEELVGKAREVILSLQQLAGITNLVHWQK